MGDALPPPSDAPDDVGPDADDLSDPEAARWGELLRRLEADAPSRPAPDPVRVAAHLAGAGDVDLLADAAADPEVRRFLVEVATTTAPPVGDDAGDGGAAALSEATRAQVLAAFDAPEVVRDLRRTARAPATPVRGGGWRRAAAAAAVLVGVAAWGWEALREARGGPSLPVEGIERVGADGVVTAEGPRAMRSGEVVRPGRGERLALRLPGGARVLLREGDAIEVVVDREARPPAPAGGEALAGLRLTAGEAVLAAGDAGPARAPALLLDDGRLVLERGAAHVGVGRVAGPVGLALAEGAIASWHAAGRPVEALAGPATRWLVEPHGPEAARGPALASRAAFADLAWFGGAGRPASRERLVDARRWRILAGPSAPATRRLDDDGLPAVRAQVTPSSPLRLAWRADDGARAAGRAVVSLRLRRETRGPGDARASSPVRVRLGGAAGVAADATAVATEAGGLATVVLDLPAGWGRDPAGGEVLLAVESDARLEATFRGVTFVPPAHVATGKAP